MKSSRDKASVARNKADVQGTWWCEECVRINGRSL